MREFLFYITKYVKWIYSLYFYVGNACVNLLRMFVSPDDRMILFVSFGGRKFDDSPKAIYEAMLKDKRFDGYRMVWAFNEPNGTSIPRGEKVKVDTLKYFITALKARVWITNSTVERGLSFKGKHTLYFNTWHGTPIKKMGTDIDMSSKTFRTKGKNRVDVFTVQGEFEADIFARVFGMQRSVIKLTGLPRNDIYSNYTKDYADGLRKKIGISREKKVILYAPTYREYEAGHNMKRELHVPMNIAKWKQTLGKDYVLLFRAHYEVAQSMMIQDDDFVKDVSSYPQLEDLMIVSDMLISDYSSMFFDYSIMHKPMLCYAYDYERYAKERGMYFDIREWLPSSADESGILRLIQNTDITMKNEAAKRFQEKYVTEFGNASQKSLEMIYNEINYNEQA